ncbi:MAG: amidohydrolase family protein [Cellvibrionaceae bacterium]
MTNTLRETFMDPDYLPFHANPKTPDCKPLEGAVDAHCHVFGPADKFPYSAKRKYTPCDASKEQLFELRDHLGFQRNVIVQASCHGTDNSALLDALEHSNDMARGVAIVEPDITEEELKKMHDLGVRAVRFNFLKRLVDETPKEVYLGISEKAKKLGWHIVVYFEAPDLPDMIPFFKKLDTTIVVDHMGRPDVSKGVDSEEFNNFLSLMENNPNVWAKVSCAERLTLQADSEGTRNNINYSDVVPFARKIVEKFPDRVLWGTDWPHPNMKSHCPDDGALVDLIPQIAPTRELQQALLVDNPMKLYWS